MRPPHDAPGTADRPPSPGREPLPKPEARPATPNNTPLLRSSVSAAHTDEQIDAALDLFGQIGRAFGVLPAPARRVSA